MASILFGQDAAFFWLPVRPSAFAARFFVSKQNASTAYLQRNNFTQKQSTDEEKIPAGDVWYGAVFTNYQADYSVAIDMKCDAPETYTTTQTENIKQLGVACSEHTCAVFCGCSDNTLGWLTGDTNMSSVRKHIKAYYLLFVHLLNKCFQDGK
jgi:hypothetical protein